MIFLFSTSFTIHGSPRPLHRSENSLEILKYLHGTCRYRISISLFVNFSTIFRWEGKGKNVQKRVEFFPQSTKYPPLSTLRSTPSPNSPHNQRPNSRTPSPRFDVHTRAHAVYVYMHICTESFSGRKFDGSSNNGMDPCVHIPVHKCGILVRVGGTRQRLSPRCDTGAGVARGRSVKENARRRKKRELGRGRGEGTGGRIEQKKRRGGGEFIRGTSPPCNPRFICLG